MPLMFHGKIAGVRRGEFDNVPRCTLQFSENKPDGSLDTLNIKVPETVPSAHFDKGQEVTLPVLYSSMNDTVYFRIDADVYNSMNATKR